MCVHPELALGGNLHDAANHRGIGFHAVEVEFADAAINSPFQFVFDERDRVRIAIPTAALYRPGRQIACLAVRAQFGNETLRIPPVKFDGAIVRRTRQQGLANARPVKDTDDLFGENCCVAPTL